MVRNPKVELAVAVAASSAFPPILSPVQLKVDPASFDRTQSGPLNVRPYTSDVVLADGGVYDNLGLETAWKRYTNDPRQRRRREDGTDSRSRSTTGRATPTACSA